MSVSVPWETNYLLPAGAGGPDVPLFGGPGFSQDVAGGASASIASAITLGQPIGLSPVLARAIVAGFAIDLIEIDFGVTLIAYDATGVHTFAGAGAMTAAMYLSIGEQALAGIPLDVFFWGQQTDASGNLTYSNYRFRGAGQPSYPFLFYNARAVTGQLQFSIMQPVPYTASSTVPWKGTTGMNIRLIDQGNQNGNDGSQIGTASVITLTGHYAQA